MVGHDAQIKKLASMQDKLSNVVASTQTGLNKTYMDADVSIASLWRAHLAMQKQLDEVCTDLTTLIETLKVTSPMKKAKKRRACIKKSPAKDHCSNSPRSRASHCDRIGGLFVDFAVRGGARLDGLRQLRQRVLYAVSGRCVCTFAREVRQRVLYAVSGHCLCTYVRVPASCNIPVSESNSFYLVTEHDRPAFELRPRSAHDRIVGPKSRVGRKSLLWRSKAHRSPASSNLHTTMRWAHRSDEVPEIQYRAALATGCADARAALASRYRARRPRRPRHRARTRSHRPRHRARAVARAALAVGRASARTRRMPARTAMRRTRSSWS